jgi:phage-related protein
MPNVRVLNAAVSEIASLPSPEQAALENAIAKLNEFGEALGYPHTSQVKGTALRELRPRRGRSPWRALYQRFGGDVFIIAAVSPEALHDPRGFRRAIVVAQQRLDSLERPS